MKLTSRCFLVLTLLAPAIPAIASAQTPEVVRGRVVDDSSHAIRGAAVIVTRGPDRMTLQDTTDSNGNFHVRFEQGTGDYLVYVTATGFNSARRRVQRQASESELIANFSLASNIAQLEAVKVSASRPVRASNPISPTQLETGASEQWKDGIRRG